MALHRKSTVFSSLVVGAMFACLFSGSVFSGSAAATDSAGPALNLHPGLRFVVGRQLSDSGPHATVRARVTWTRSDASGICRQRVRVRALDTDVVRKRIVPVGVTRQGFDFVVDRAYRVNVKITDCAGNSTRKSGRYEAKLLQETTAVLDLSDPWDIVARRSASGGALASGESGTQAVLFGAARSVALVTQTAPGAGTAEISSWNTHGVVSLDKPQRARVVVYQDRWRDLTAQDNVLMEVLPSGPFVVDAFLVG
jgi:hypothetical protein